MGFLSIVRKLREKEKEMKLLIIGLDNGVLLGVGKSIIDEASVASVIAPIFRVCAVYQLLGRKRN